MIGEMRTVRVTLMSGRFASGPEEGRAFEARHAEHRQHGEKRHSAQRRIRQGNSSCRVTVRRQHDHDDENQRARFDDQDRSGGEPDASHCNPRDGQGNRHRRDHRRGSSSHVGTDNGDGIEQTRNCLRENRNRDSEIPEYQCGTRRQCRPDTGALEDEAVQRSCCGQSPRELSDAERNEKHRRSCRSNRSQPDVAGTVGDHPQGDEHHSRCRSDRGE